MTTFAFYIENILGLVREPCTHTFSPTVISKCLRIRAQSREIVRTTKLQYVLRDKENNLFTDITDSRYYFYLV